MKSLENLIKEKMPSVPALSFCGCVFKKKTRTAHFSFFSSDSVTAETEEKIAAILKEESGVKLAVAVEILKPPKNPDAIHAALKEYIKNNFLPVFCTLTENDITVDRVLENDITVYVTVKDSLKSYADSAELSGKCSEYLRARYLTPSNVIVRINAGKGHTEEIKDYIAAKNDYQKVRPQKTEGAAQQKLFEEDGIIPAYLLENTFVVFDFETTGFDGLIDKIIEIGAVKISGGVVTEAFTTLVNPTVPIPKDSIRVHGITDIMVKDAPTIADVLPDFLRFAGSSPLIAHNAEFDSKFLRAAGLASGFNFDFEFIDTLELARRYIKGLSNYKLGTIANYLGAEINPNHRALADAQATAEVFIEIIKRREKKST